MRCYPKLLSLVKKSNDKGKKNSRALAQDICLYLSVSPSFQS